MRKPESGFDPTGKMGYPAALQVRRTMVRATSLTDWCFFSTVSLFLNEI